MLASPVDAQQVPTFKSSVDLVRVDVRTEGVIERIERETTGLYVVGVELPANTPRDKALQVRIQVNRRDVTVRSPEFVVPRRGN